MIVEDQAAVPVHATPQEMTMKLRAFAFAVCAQLLGASASAQTAPYSGHATYLDQGWSTDTARWWYSLTQGTAFIPYAWFVALEQPVGTELFSAPGNLQRMGFSDRAAGPTIQSRWVAGRFCEGGAQCQSAPLCVLER